MRRMGADFKGTDHQRDTCFRCASGRLKLREGNIEQNLIHYRREDGTEPKDSLVTLFGAPAGSSLKALLTDALGVLAVVNKRREIYFIENVKFHVDDVEGLGTFMEIEAIDVDGNIGRQRLRERCEHYMKILDVRDEDLIWCSYSDMILKSEGP